MAGELMEHNPLLASIQHKGLVCLVLLHPQPPGPLSHISKERAGKEAAQPSCVLQFAM